MGSISMSQLIVRAMLNNANGYSNGGYDWGKNYTVLQRERVENLKNSQKQLEQTGFVTSD